MIEMKDYYTKVSDHGLETIHPYDMYDFLYDGGHAKEDGRVLVGYYTAAGQRHDVMGTVFKLGDGRTVVQTTDAPVKGATFTNGIPCQ